MLSGFYTAASGILTRQNEINTIGNNLTNINTPGYKAERVIIGTFEQELAVRLQGQSVTALSESMATSAIVADVQTIFSDGLMKETGRNIDIAFDGEGFFEIAGSNGEQYLTRNGQFDIDAEGYLILPSIGRVQGENGDIQVNTDQITVSPQGVITDANGSVIDTLTLLTPTDGSTLRRYDNNMYVLENGEIVEASGEVMQGIIELSNVDMNAEMANLIAAQRGFQNCSSALQIIDELNSMAISKLGSLT